MSMEDWVFSFPDLRKGKHKPVTELLGKTIINIEGCEEDSEEIIFTCSDGTMYKMWHEQDCCESVQVADVIGNVEDLLHWPITLAEEESQSFDYGDVDTTEYEYGYYDDSHTWTWYKFATVKGYVTVRWLGQSNGYYSEYVSFAEIIKEE